VISEVRFATLSNFWCTSAFSRHRECYIQLETSQQRSMLIEGVVSYLLTNRYIAASQMSSKRHVFYLPALELHVVVGCSQKGDTERQSRLLMSWSMRSETHTLTTITTFLLPNTGCDSDVSTGNCGRREAEPIR
jgi:hypothetical protein